MKHSIACQIQDIMKYKQNEKLFKNEILFCDKKAMHSIVLKQRDLPSKHTRLRLRLYDGHFGMMYWSSIRERSSLSLGRLQRMF